MPCYRYFLLGANYILRFHFCNCYNIVIKSLINNYWNFSLGNENKQINNENIFLSHSINSNKR